MKRPRAWPPLHKHNKDSLKNFRLEPTGALANKLIPFISEKQEHPDYSFFKGRSGPLRYTSVKSETLVGGWPLPNS